MSRPNGDADKFPKTDRFSCRRKLGKGGMGIVYEAYDHERQITVALKTILRTTAKSIYNFKREFRTMADLVHPNLVSLYDLLSVNNQWFFTMELIDGVNFLTYSSVTKQAAKSGDTVVNGAPVSTVARAVETGGAPEAAEAKSTIFEGGDPPASPSSGSTSDPVSSPRSWESAFSPSSGSPAVSSQRSLGSSGVSVQRSRQGRRDPDLSVELARSIPLLPKDNVCRFDLERLRSALRQLCEGLFTLHRNGYVHRDIKPSNVLVSSEGRVVLLDFGIVADLLPRSSTARKRARRFAGTPKYMAPEMLDGTSTPSQAADWYSVGIMLYEALTGWRPFEGVTKGSVALIKKQVPLPHPREVVPAAPEDLSDLCADLIAHDPVSRPTGRQVLERLGQGDEGERLVSASRASLVGADREIGSLFVGRAEEVAALRSSFDAVRKGAAVVQRIQGPSGIGKSTLVWRFLDELIRGDEALVFTGRCYDQETVPFKAVDSLVDSLVRYLLELPPKEVEPLLPRDVRALAQLFPVLLGVTAVLRAYKQQEDVADLVERRRRGFAAFRELIHRLSMQAPVVLYIDDLQWGDIDSMPLLSGLMRPPDAPSVLLLLSYRTEEMARSPLMQELMRPGSLFAQSENMNELEVGPLSADSARELALAVVKETGADASAIDIAGMASQMTGEPYLIRELIPYAAASGGKSGLAPTEIVLDDLLYARISQLTPPARRLLELVAVSGKPVSESIIRRAADLAEDQEKARRQLQATRLLRLSSDNGQKRLESQHDRIRETVVKHLSGELLRDHHRCLVLQHEAVEQPDAEVLLVHSRGLGDVERTYKYAVRAAAAAAESLAFDRATQMYQLALAQNVADASSERQLRTRLAEALSNIGRGKEAADNYLAAVEGAERLEAIDLRRKAALQQLFSGHVGEGLENLRDLLKDVGQRLPRTSFGALLSLIWRRIRVMQRGLKYKEVPDEQQSEEELLRLEVFVDATSGLSIIDPIRAWDLQSRTLLYSLEAGHLFSIGRAALLEAGFASSAGGVSRKRIEQLIDQAQTIGRKLDNPLLLGMRDIALGMICFLQGRWREALDHCDRAEEICQTSLTGTDWELNTARFTAIWSLARMGWISESKRRIEPLLEDARMRGDILAHLTLGIEDTYTDVALDRPDRAKKQLDELEKLLFEGEFHVQHLSLVASQVDVALYQRDGRAALQLFDASWPAMRRSHMRRVQVLRILMYEQRARASLLAAAEDPSSAPRLFKQVARDIRRLRREKVLWADALAKLINAALADSSGQREEAIGLLEEVESDFSAVSMHSYQAVSRRQRGRLLGGKQGRHLIRRADVEMADLGIQNPSRYMRYLAPGFGQRTSQKAAGHDR